MDSLGSQDSSDEKGTCERQTSHFGLRVLAWKSALGSEQKPLTINPGHAEGLKDGDEEKAHATGCIVVEELKHVHAALRGRRRKGQPCDPRDPVTL